MSRFVFLLVLAIPIAELWLLIAVGGAIGGLSCVLLVIATAVIGGILARRQGFDVAQKMRRRMAAGEPVAAEMVDAFMLLFAGVLLLFPGLMTDVIGFLLLVPTVRVLIKDRVFQGRFAKSYQGSAVKGEKVIDIDITKS